VIGSKTDLLRSALEEVPDNFELHKPWVDRLTLKCDKCEGVMHREDYVLDTWHNSGASPYARFSDNEFEKFVPTDFHTQWESGRTVSSVSIPGVYAGCKGQKDE
jgi:isoleucyl-tRNA synthetase